MASSLIVEAPRTSFQRNIPARVASMIGQKLHRQPKHPIEIVKRRIAREFEGFSLIDDLHPLVTTKQCFDDLLVPPDHISRSPSDTFYDDESHVLRPHTSAHQTQFLRQGLRQFLVCGDCYRRDEIDARHYPVFHQLEGVRIWNDKSEDQVFDDLRASLERMVQRVLPSSDHHQLEVKWVDAFFPFTNPSLEMEVRFNGKMLELLGCGMIHEDILAACDLEGYRGWAFGIGLERIAMTLFDIPDIRLFWTQDERFHQQFNDEPGANFRFKPFSKYPETERDLSFWHDPAFVDNDFYALVREVAGDLVEDVKCIDSFTHPITRQMSRCFRITYRAIDRTLFNDEINALQEVIRNKLQCDFNVILR